MRPIRYLIAACLLCAGLAGVVLAECKCPKACDDCRCTNSRAPGEPCQQGICPDCPVSVARAGASVGGMETPSGKPAACPLPKEFHLTNRGGSDGAGLCVFCSIQHSAVWASVPELEDMFKWMWDKPGGGYPSKVDAMIKRKCEQAGRPVPQYVQIESKDLAPLKLACKSGRMPAITYGVSPTGRYNGRRIAHMVSLVHADEWFGILDNNYPHTVEWLTEEEFKRAYYQNGTGSGWAVILLEPGPPPPPYTPKPREAYAMTPWPLLMASLALNGWGSGGCGRSAAMPAPMLQPAFQPVQPVRVATGYRWVDTDKPNQKALYLDGVQLGNWWLDSNEYRRLNGDGSFSAAACPADPPKGARAQAEEQLPTGVVAEHISDNRYTYRGKECSRRAVLDAIEGNLVDDSATMWVTVVGPEAERRAVLKDLADSPQLAAWKGKLRIKGYGPDHWAVKDSGFQPGKPSIHIEAADGASLWRQEDYAHGAEGLAAALEWADRRQRPDYDPEKDPGPGKPWRKPDPPPTPAPAPNPPENPAPDAHGVDLPPGTFGGCCSGLVAAIIAYLVARRRNES
jgi:hypothetical protein